MDSSCSSLGDRKKKRGIKFMQMLLEKGDAVKPLFHLMLGMLLQLTAFMMVVPVLTDVLFEALCPGSKECSEAVYLSGIQQVVTGIGTVLVTPVLGNLSDEYGRKPLLMIPFVTAVLPMAILAYSRTKPFVYAYMLVGTIVRMFSDVTCLAFAYVGDVVEEGHRALAIGALMGSLSTGYVIGILVARVLPESRIFQIAAVLMAAAAIYMKFFLVDTNAGPPLLGERSRGKPEPSKPLLMRSTSSITETIDLIKSNKLLTQVAIIVFFSSLGESGIQASLLYYLKATFSFGKDQFAELLLISGTTAMVSQLAVMPVFVHFLGEKTVLCLGLLASFVHALMYGFAWSSWVPYLCASMSILCVFVFPCTGSIISKAAGPDEQGKLQGFMAGVRSLATIISPLAISPLTALFLSDGAPFKCPGFGIICAALVMVVALVQALLMEPPPPPMARLNTSTKYLSQDLMSDLEP